MNTIYAFYNNQVIAHWVLAAGYVPSMKELPDETYVLMNENTWYLYKWTSLMPISLADVPKELRLLVLLLQ